ncbi:hypothetical protein BGX28_005328 [Mortierella sp. GBA30]|nr:hypothetical protein BGX28_005328 [Mortierella sp. GBA30]
MVFSRKRPETHNDPEAQPLLLELEAEEEGEALAIDTQIIHGKNEAEADSIWLQKLQSRPWHLRPSILWLMPLVLVLGVVTGLMGSSVEQLTIQIICKDYLEGTPKNIAALDPMEDRCKSLLTLAKWTSLSDIYGRKLLVFLSMLVSWAADCTSTSTRSVQMGYILLCFSLGNIFGPYLGGYAVKATGDLIVAIKISIAALVVIVFFLIFIPESLRSENQRSAVNEEVVQVLQDQAASRQPIANLSPVTRIYESVKRGFLIIFDPLLLFVPGKVPWSPKIPSKYTLALLLLVSCLMHVLVVGEASLLIPMTNLVFSWTAYEDGLYYSYAGICSFIVFLGVFPLLQSLYKRYNVRSNETTTPLFEVWEQEEDEVSTLLERVDNERRQNTLPKTSTVDADTMAAVKMDVSFILGASVLYLVASFIVPLSLSVPALFFTQAVQSVASIGSMAVRSLSTTVIPSHQTGRVLGAISVSDAMAGTIAHLLYGSVFAYTSATRPWFYYHVSSGLSASALLVMSTVWVLYRA